MAKHVRMNSVNNMNSENCYGRESGTVKNSWIQIAAGQTVSRRQNYPQFQTASPQYDTYKDQLLEKR